MKTRLFLILLKIFQWFPISPRVISNIFTMQILQVLKIILQYFLPRGYGRHYSLFKKHAKYTPFSEPSQLLLSLLRTFFLQMSQRLLPHLLKMLAEISPSNKHSSSFYLKLQKWWSRWHIPVTSSTVLLVAEAEGSQAPAQPGQLSDSVINKKSWGSINKPGR